MGPLHALTAEFQAKLGRALTRWQYVETGLFVLAHALMETRYEVSSTVFFHIKSAENKLSLVDKLCRLNLSQQVWQGEWRDLRKELSAHIDIRNALAHFEVMFVDRPVSTGGTWIELGLVTHHLDIYSARGGTDKGLYLIS